MHTQTYWMRLSLELQRPWRLGNDSSPLPPPADLPSPDAAQPAAAPWRGSDIDAFEIPARLQAEVRRRDPEADVWLTDLPTIWRDVSARWHLSIAGEPAAGAVSLVVPVHRTSGLAALKLVSPTVDASKEAAALQAFNGNGAVRLLGADLDRQALLLEWLDGPTLATHPDPAEAIGIAGGVARQLAGIPAPADAPTLSGDTVGWMELLQRQHSIALDRGEAAPEDLFALVVEIVRQLASDSAPTLTHGDLSLSNIMRAGGDRWVAIDPYFIAGTVANEAHTVIRSTCRPSCPARARVVCSANGPPGSATPPGSRWIRRSGSRWPATSGRTTGRSSTAATRSTWRTCAAPCSSLRIRWRTASLDPQQSCRPVSFGVHCDRWSERNWLVVVLSAGYTGDWFSYQFPGRPGLANAVLGAWGVMLAWVAHALGGALTGV